LGIFGVFWGLTIALLLHFRTNFHVVVDGLAYRSGQLDPVTLENYIQSHHFQTIINLRGSGPQADWYMQERALARRHHLRYIDMPIDSINPLRPEEVLLLLDVLKDKDATPILIHCQSGIDRSGSMAVALSLLLDNSRGLETARDQLQWNCGNLPWFRSTKNSRAYLDRYQQWLDRNGLDHSREHFCQWALTVDKSHS
jgi:protein tyrosine/serine phosphatase